MEEPKKIKAIKSHFTDVFAAGLPRHEWRTPDDNADTANEEPATTETQPPAQT